MGKVVHCESRQLVSLPVSAEGPGHLPRTGTGANSAPSRIVGKGPFLFGLVFPLPFSAQGWGEFEPGGGAVCFLLSH